MNTRMRIYLLRFYGMIFCLISGNIAAQQIDVLYDSLFEMATVVGTNHEGISLLHLELAKRAMYAALYDLAVQHAGEVIELDVSDSIKVEAYNVLGLSESYRYNYKESIGYLTRAVAIIESGDNPLIMPQVYHNLGENYGLVESLDSMKFYFQKSIAMRKESNHGAFDFKKLFDKAIMHFYNKENVKSRSIFQELGKKHKSHIPTSYLAKVYGYISLINKRQGEYGDCLNSANQQLEYAKKANFNPEKIYAYKFLSDCNEGLKQYESALYFRNIYYHLKDSIRKNTEATRMLALQSSSKYLGRIQQLKIENQLQKRDLKQERNLRYWLLSLLLVSGLIIGASIFIARLRKEKARLNRELKNKAEEALDQKSMLLKEVHHRVKNNLQSLSGLLFLQSSKIKDEDSILLLRQTQERLNAISLLHEDLYAPVATQTIMFDKYLEQLAANTRQKVARDLTIDVLCDPFKMDLDTAMPLALICNELFTNSIKHADVSQEEHLNIVISCKKLDSGLKIVHRDNGAPFEIESHPTSFGMYLIDSLLKKYRGTIELEKLGDDASQFVILLRDINLINIAT